MAPRGSGGELDVPRRGSGSLRRAHASGRVRAVPLFVGSNLAVWTLVGVKLRTTRTFVVITAAALAPSRSL